MNKPLIRGLNLHLEYKYTDRGGRQVFEIFNAEDNKRMLHPLGQIRMTPPVVHVNTTLGHVRWVACDDERKPLAVDDAYNELESEQQEMTL